jgi:hypothetical protein
MAGRMAARLAEDEARVAAWRATLAAAEAERGAALRALAASRRGRAGCGPPPTSGSAKTGAETFGSGSPLRNRAH